MNSDIFSKVLYVGPSLHSRGGVTSVLTSYKRAVSPFRFLPTNSPHGTLPGMARWLLTMAVLPWWRLRGVRIVHAHGASGRSFVRKNLLLRWARLWGFATIHHYHGGGMKDYFETVGTGKIRAALEANSAFAVLSDKWADYAGTVIDRKLIEVIPNIITPPSPFDKPSPGSMVRLLFLGDILERKGVFDLVTMLADHSDTLRGRVHLTICGTGEADRLHKLIADRAVTDMVEYAGWVDGEAKERLMRGGDIFVLPSYVEGLPISILEAMAYGMAVIATAVGGIPEVIRDGVNGRLAAPRDNNPLYEALTSYIERPDIIAATGARNRRDASEYFPDRVVTRLETMYSQILNKHRK